MTTSIFKSKWQFGAKSRDFTDGMSTVIALSEIVAVQSGGDDRGAWGWCTGPLFSGRGYDGRVLTPNTTLAMDCPPYSWNNTSDVNFNRRSTPDNTDAGGVAARSYHEGGVHAALADGSVRFVTENIDQTLYFRLLAIQDGNPIDDF